MRRSWRVSVARHLTWQRHREQLVRGCGAFGCASGVGRDIVEERRALEGLGIDRARLGEAPVVVDDRVASLAQFPLGRRLSSLSDLSRTGVKVAAPGPGTKRETNGGANSQSQRFETRHDGSRRVTMRCANIRRHRTVCRSWACPARRILNGPVSPHHQRKATVVALNAAWATIGAATPPVRCASHARVNPMANRPGNCTA